MNVSLGPRWEKFIEAAVAEGRYGSASEVVREGLRLVEEREAKLKALREAIAEGDASPLEAFDVEGFLTDIKRRTDAAE